MREVKVCRAEGLDRGVTGRCRTRGLNDGII